MSIRFHVRLVAVLALFTVVLAAVPAAAGVRPGVPVLIQGPDGPDWVEALSISPDGIRLAAGRYDGTLGIYDLGTLRSVSEPVAVFEDTGRATPETASKRTASR